MTVAVNDILRITAVMVSSHGTTIENVFGVRCNAVSDGTDVVVMEDIALWMDNAYTHVHVDFPSTVTFTEIRGHNVTQNVPLPTVAWPVLTAGSAAGDIVPEGVASLVLFRTGFLKVLGRKFLGPYVESAITDGLFVADVITHLGAWASELIVGFPSGVSLNTYQYGIIDKVHAFRAILAIVVEALPAYQRRRRRGRGI